MLRPLILLAFSTTLLAACTSKSSSTPPAPTPAAAPTAAKPAEPKPAEPKPVAKPAEAAQSETKPASAPAAKPADTAGAVDPAIAAMRTFIETQKVDKAKSGWKTKLAMPPKLTFAPERKYFWVLTTSEGPIKIRLMPDVAPMHVSSTIYLAELGFYDGLSFHRVIPDFMAQGGCPVGNGSGSPGYKYASEFAPNVKHDRPGLLSMANTGAPSTDGSQFFLTFVPTPFLDGKHTVFGEIVDGMETLKKLESFGSKPAGTTKKPLAIQSTKIVVE